MLVHWSIYDNLMNFDKKAKASGLRAQKIADIATATTVAGASPRKVAHATSPAIAKEDFGGREEGECDMMGISEPEEFDPLEDTLNNIEMHLVNVDRHFELIQSLYEILRADVDTLIKNGGKAVSSTTSA